MLLRHKNNRDVAANVMTEFYDKSRHEWFWRVEWWNIGACHDPYPTGIEQGIRIQSEDRKDWEDFTGRLPPPSLVNMEFK